MGGSGWGFSALFFLFDHADGFRRAFFRTDPTALAVFEVDLDRDGAFHYCVRTVKPADKAGWALISARRALAVIDLRPESSPVSGPAPFSFAQPGMSVGKFVCFRCLSHCSLPESSPPFPNYIRRFREFEDPLRGCPKTFKKIPCRHSRAGGNPSFLSLFWTPAYTGGTIRGTCWTRSEIIPQSLLTRTPPFRYQTSVQAHANWHSLRLIVPSYASRAPATFLSAAAPWK